MSPATIALIQQFIALAVQYGPSLAAQGKILVGLIESGADPTAEQQAEIDAALKQADTELALAIGGRG